MFIQERQDRFKLAEQSASSLLAAQLNQLLDRELFGKIPRERSPLSAQNERAGLLNLWSSEPLFPLLLETALRGDIYPWLTNGSESRNVSALDLHSGDPVEILVEQAALATASKAIPLLYSATPLLDWLSQLVGMPVEACVDERDRYLLVKHNPTSELGSEPSVWLTASEIEDPRARLAAAADRLSASGETARVWLVLTWAYGQELERKIALHLPILDASARDTRFRSLEINEKLRLELSVEDGFRIVTTTAIAPGETIYTARDILDFDTPTYQTVQVGEAQHVLELVFANLNHSCDPAVFVDADRLALVAERFLYAGEEINFFYPANEWQMDRPFTCQCGSDRCIGQVAGASQLSARRLQNYRLNQHIWRRLPR